MNGFVWEMKPFGSSKTLVDCFLTDLSVLLHRGKKKKNDSSLASDSEMRWELTRSWGSFFDPGYVEFNLKLRWPSQLLRHLRDGKLLLLACSVALSDQKVGIAYDFSIFNQLMMHGGRLWNTDRLSLATGHPHMLDSYPLIWSPKWLSLMWSYFPLVAKVLTSIICRVG